MLQQIKDKPVKVAVDVEFYDGNGNKFDLTQHNAIVALNSLNHWTGASYVDSGDKPRALTVEAKDKMATPFVELGTHMQMVHP